MNNKPSELEIKIVYKKILLEKKHIRKVALNEVKNSRDKMKRNET